MRKHLPLRLTSLIFFITISASSQTSYGYTDYSIKLESDSNTRSVLVSNVLANQPGDYSPIIGTGTWKDQNMNLEARSLLYFEYGALPLLLKPEMITSAELVLKPINPQTGKQEFVSTDMPQFFVNRIAEPWVDSLTTWVAKPAIAGFSSPAHVKYKNKNNPEVRVDVTDIVKEMFAKGNNGFMFSQKDSVAATPALPLQWYASARNEDENLRPALVIRFAASSAYLFPTSQRITYINRPGGDDISPIPALPKMLGTPPGQPRGYVPVIAADYPRFMNNGN